MINHRSPISIEYNKADRKILIHVFEHKDHKLLPIKIEIDHLLEMGIDDTIKFIGERIVYFLPELVREFEKNDERG
jgi:hypothetical protein